MMPTKSDMAKYIKNYKFHSLYIKNMLSLLLLIFVPLIGVVSLTYFSYQNIRRNEINAQNEGYIVKVSADMDMVIKEAKSLLIYLGYHTDVQLFMYTDAAGEDIYYQLQNIYELLKIPVLSKEYVSSIYIYSPKISKVITHLSVWDYERFTDKPCIENYIAQEDKATGQWLALSESNKKRNGEKQLSVYFNMNLGPQYGGVCVMNIDLKELGKALNFSPDEQIWITDGQTILYATDTEAIGQPVDIIQNYSALLRDHSFIDSENIQRMKTSENTGLSVISQFSLNDHTDQLNRIRNFLILSILLMILVTVVLFFIIAVKIFAPIKMIMSTIEENQNQLQDLLYGENQILAEQNELQYIVNYIKKTVSTNKNIENELSERVRLLKKAQAVALQSQINPHFFNNTLETINWMAIRLLGGENDISHMAGALSTMLRMALENTDTIIPFRSELEHAQTYIEIQQKRYENKFDMVWEISEALADAKTIKILLQPIIENAIYHGIKPLTNKGIIRVSANVINAVVHVSVYDNGLGISPARQKELNRLVQSGIIHESAHIGLANVGQRIRLYFGEGYGLTIASEENAYTQVTVTFPLIT